MYRYHDLQTLAQTRSLNKTREYISLMGWRWYDEHKYEEVFSALFGLVKVKVYHLEVLFIRLFGPRPGADGL